MVVLNHASSSSFRVENAISQPLSRFGLSSLCPQYLRRSCKDFRVHLRAISPPDRYRPSGDVLNSSAWNDKPYVVTKFGKKVYVDERDVVGFLDPPLELLPFAPDSYSGAAYLWKKIDDIPAERRPRLLEMLKPRLVSRAWAIAESRFYDAKASRKTKFGLLDDDGNEGTMLEFWTCRKSGGPFSIAFFNSFKKALFRCNDGRIYGRFIGQAGIAEMGSRYFPLYFAVEHVDRLVSTEEPCDVAFEFGEGVYEIHDYPHGFPKPAKHPWPLGDQVVVYVRYIGPGVAVGQAWKEGKNPEQVPRRLCGEILMVKDFNPPPRVSAT